MSKSTHFSGQPIYLQLLKSLSKDKILQFSQQMGGERGVRHFDAWQHLVVMLYGVINRFDSLREIIASFQLDSLKLGHLGVSHLPRRSTLADANARRSESIFEAIYHDLYQRYKDVLLADSLSKNVPAWLKQLYIIDATTITLFSNLIFKGSGRNPKSGKKKGGIKVHTIIHANEGVPCDVKFTSAATHDSFMLQPSRFEKGDVITMDRGYIDYEKMEQLSQKQAIYVTKMKKKLTYDTIENIAYQTPDGLMKIKIDTVCFSKKSNGQTLTHQARIITYPHLKGKRPKMVSLLTNDMNLDPTEIIDIYAHRWAIELLFKQIKQNFLLKYFYGESANAIKIQIWTTLIANLLMTIKKRGISHPWSFSGFATMIRIALMHYIDFDSFFNCPEKDWIRLCEHYSKSPPDCVEKTLFD